MINRTGLESAADDPKSVRVLLLLTTGKRFSMIHLSDRTRIRSSNNSKLANSDCAHNSSHKVSLRCELKELEVAN